MGTKTKGHVRNMVENLRVEIGGITTIFKLSLLPLGSRNILIGMDWMETHRAKVDCYENVIEFLNDEGESTML